MAFLVSKAGLKMCLWYGMLYVVVEGWRDTKLSDAEVDRLLASASVKPYDTQMARKRHCIPDHAGYSDSHVRSMASWFGDLARSILDFARLVFAAFSSRCIHRLPVLCK
jgi:hypothetical protein